MQINNDLVNIPYTELESVVTSDYVAPHYVRYMVRNSICYVHFSFWTNAVVDVETIFANNLPIPASNEFQFHVINNNLSDAVSMLTIRIYNDGTLRSRFGAARQVYVGTISYPIKI